MTQFYEVRDSDQNLVWIAAHETAGEHRIVVYLPNTGTWQHSTAVDDDFYAPDRAATYTPVSAEQAVGKLPTLRKLNAKTASWLLEDLTSSTTVTAAARTAHSPHCTPNERDAGHRDPRQERRRQVGEGLRGPHPQRCPVIRQ